MSEFVYLFRASEAEQREAMGTPERAQRSLEAWLAWIRELEANGHLKHPGQALGLGGYWPWSVRPSVRLWTVARRLTSRSIPPSPFGNWKGPSGGPERLPPSPVAVALTAIRSILRQSANWRFVVEI